MDPWSFSFTLGSRLEIRETYFDSTVTRAKVIWSSFSDSFYDDNAALEYDPISGTLKLVSKKDENRSLTFSEVSLINPASPDTIISFTGQGTHYRMKKTGWRLIDHFVSFRYINTPDSLIADTNKQKLACHIIAVDLIRRIQLRIIATGFELSPSGIYAPAPQSDTSFVADTLFSVYPYPDSVFFQAVLPGQKNGTLVKYQLGYTNGTTGGVHLMPEKIYRTYPVPGKFTPSLRCPDVSDLLRLVYLILGAFPPTPADCLGLDMDSSGELDMMDLEELLQVWKGNL